MKKIFFISLFLFLFLFTSTFAEGCKYQGKLEQCNSALKSFTGKGNLKYIDVGGSLKDFEDFPCIQDSEEARVFQIATDENFKKIDKEMDEYLKSLYESKNYYFGKEKTESYFEGVEHIFLKKDEFLKKYNEGCVKSFQETAECTENQAFSEPEDKPSVSVLGAINFINGQKSSGSCFLLAKTKSNIFLEVAYNGLLLNREQISKDMRKEYVQHQRDNYGIVLEEMRINQAYIERLNSKWSSKTRHTLNS